MRMLVIYVVARFALAGVLFGGLWLIGLETFLAAAVAVLLSIPLSYVLLRDVRDRATAAVQARSARRTEERRRLRGS